ncbi:MAG TPA: EAL domain-containing protein, partial [Rhodocyclaceae bacterium]|nr:EAL domain-containing protein [Rhodocyclaceae bacterium]
DSGQTAATYAATNPSDGTHRLYTFQRLPNAPWYISAGQAWEDYVQEWEFQAARYIGFALLFLVVSVLLARQVWRGWRKQLAVESELRLAAIAFETQEGISITDARNRFIRVNRAFTQVTGYAPEEIIGKTPALLKSGRHDDAFYREMWHILKQAGYWQGEVWNRRKNGEIFPQWMTITAVHNEAGEIANYVAAFQDISQRKQAEKQIQRLAFYDPLTGLPNRALLLERIAQAMASCARQNNHGALLFIDLDNFKTLNDTLGHDQGDRLLVLVAERLKASVRESDTVARLGGDEFVAMLEGLDSREEEAANQAEAIGEKIRAALDATDNFDGLDHHNTPSIGIALFRGHDSTVDELLKRGDLAMYEAKAAGGNSLRFFDPAMQAVVETRARLEAEMRKAIQNNELELYYQLQYDAAGHAIGAEALLRWHHPEKGLVPPGQFIPLAESTGLILAMGEWVLHTACRQLAAWQAAPASRHLRMAVNVSARQFRQAGFADQVRTALAESGADPAGLKLEITESLLVDEVDEAIAKMDDIVAMGVEFSLDDFGTGYSSLSYLKRLPLRQLKIDQSFVNDMLDNPSDAAIIRSVLALGQSLGMLVIAEGVETAAQRDFLAQLGCHAFQGYFFARPAPVEELRLSGDILALTARS